jgi:hypothetical protein
MKHTAEYTVLKYSVDSTQFWSRQDHESYDNSGTASWLLKEAQVYQWCEQYPSSGLFSFSEHYGKFYFEYEQDMIYTMLRWS